MSQPVPVNIDILKWARETSGLSVLDVARRLKKEPDEIKRWERGESAPTYPQLERLAYEVYKRPAAVFFFPAVPEESSPKADFRTLPGETANSMPPEIIKIYKKAKIYQLNLKELDGESKTQRLLDSFQIGGDSDIPDLAGSVREFLKIDFQTQTEWKTLDEGIEAWRVALATCGIYVFKDAFRNDRFSGLSIYDESWPVVQINNSMAKARQIFSIFHEVAHLLYKSGGVDALQESFYDRFRDDYYAIEQTCNEFAGEFLLPSAVFQINTPAFNEANLTEMADSFKVSREVVLRKYLKSKLINYETYKFYSGKWSKEFLESRRNKKEDDSGGSHYNTKKSYLGKHYINLAFSHYYQGKIDIETLAGYLDVKVSNLPDFERHAMR